MTLDMLLDQSWKQILSEEQQNAMSRFIPVAYTSFDIDGENFIYTCSQNALSESTRVRRLNPPARACGTAGGCCSAMTSHRNSGFRGWRTPPRWSIWTSAIRVT